MNEKDSEHDICKYSKFKKFMNKNVWCIYFFKTILNNFIVTFSRLENEIQNEQEKREIFRFLNYVIYRVKYDKIR